MELIKVSVIIPVYNLEGYIGRCIQSILNQTLKDIEIIVINDGSTDKSEEIILSYAKKDYRIKYIYQCNQGVSVARNKGINAACGEFLTFADGDDYMKSPMLEEMYELANQEHYDIVFCTFSQYSNEFCYPTSNYIPYYEYIENIISDIYPPAVWGGIYRRKLINVHKISFEKGLSYGEDILFIIQLLLEYRKNVGIVNYDYYIIEHRIGSVTRRIAPERYKDIFILNEKLDKIIKRFKEQDNYYQLLRKYFLYNIFIAMGHVLSSELSIKDKFKYLSIIKCNKYANRNVRDLSINFKYKMKIWLLRYTHPVILWLQYTLNKFIRYIVSIVKNRNKPYVRNHL